jgi:hypothetical protein
MTPDQIAFWTFVVSIVAALAAIVAIFVGLRAIYYAKQAPTTEDLRRVEKNTAETSRHLEGMHGKIASMDTRLDQQAEHDTLVSRANRVSTLIEGEDLVGNCLSIRLTLKDPKVTLIRLDLLNERGIVFGSPDCEATAYLQFTATIDPATILKWFDGGTITVAGWSARSQLGLRVHMLVSGNNVHRQVAVILYRANQSDPANPLVRHQVWRIEGSV